jgi:hypothetical protein
MLDQIKFNEIRQTSVGKDVEKIQSRVKEAWLPLKKPQREEILNLSGLTIHAVMRSYQKGKLSLKLALAMAQSLKINPYFLTGDSDERDVCTDEIINQFLADNGHASLLENSEKQRRKYNRKQPSEQKANEIEKLVTGVSLVETAPNPDAPVEAVSDAVPVESIPALAPIESTPVNGAAKGAAPPLMTQATDGPVIVPVPYDLLLSTIQKKVISITESEQDRLNAMPVETAEQLLKGLYLRTEYSEEANHLASLVKMLLLQ